MSKTLQVLPCWIEYNGEAPISTYFVESQENTSSFRGRGLKAACISIPSGYKGSTHLH